MINDKRDCIDSIAGILESTSIWRKATAGKWPNDPRNIKAAAMLDALASNDLSDERWAELKVHFSWASKAWRNALSETARSVGFHHRPQDIDSFAAVLVHRLSLESVAA
jgi:hypothetical protein